MSEESTPKKKSHKVLWTILTVIIVGFALVVGFVYSAVTGIFTNTTPLDSNWNEDKNYAGDKDPYPVNQKIRVRGLGLEVGDLTLDKTDIKNYVCAPVTLKNLEDSGSLAYGPTSFFLTVDGNEEKFDVSGLHGTEISADELDAGKEITAKVCLQAPDTIAEGDKVNIHYSVNQFSKKDNASWTGEVLASEDK